MITASTGSAKNDAYRWAKAQYLDTGRCTPGALGYYVDAYALSKLPSLVGTVVNGVAMPATTARRTSAKRTASRVPRDGRRAPSSCIWEVDVL